MQDKVMPVIQVKSLDEVRAFYLEVLGFEEGASPPHLEGEFSAFSYGSSNIAVSTPTFCEEGLRLGQLQGNAFSIVLREARVMEAAGEQGGEQGGT